MRGVLNQGVIRVGALKAIALAAALAGCASNDGDGSSSSQGGAGTGVPAAGSGTAGSAGMPAAGSSAGESAAGSGPVAGAGASGSGAGAPASGSGGAGMSAEAGMGGGGADPMTGVTAEQCLAAVMAAGTTITECEMCLCQPGNCQAELGALEGDAAANAMLACVQANGCEGQCCLCGAPCDMLGSDFGMGPCGDELQTAAGVTPGMGTEGAIANAMAVMMNCAAEGPADNACANVVRLGACVAEKCASACSQPMPCM